MNKKDVQMKKRKAIRKNSLVNNKDIYVLFATSGKAFGIKFGLYRTLFSISAYLNS